MPIFQLGAYSLRYEDIGAGRPVVLIHGFTNFGLSWSPQLAALVHAGYRVILPDLRGHGASSATNEPCAVGELARDIAELLDHLDIGSAALCGLSLGGMVALQLAVEQPRHAACLVICNSRASFTSPDISALVVGWIDLLAQPEGPLKRLQVTWPNLVNESFRNSPAGTAAFEAWVQVASSVKGSSLANVAKGMSCFDLRDRLPAINVPTMVIAGENDRLFTAEDSRAMSRAIGGARFVIIPGAGHLSNLDSPDRFNRLLVDFLRTHFPVS